MKIETYLDQYTTQLVSEFKEIISEPLPEEVRCVNILIFREALPSVPFHIYFTDRFQGPSKTKKPIEPLANLDYLISPEIYISREDLTLDCLALEDEESESICWDQLQEEFAKEDLSIAEWISRCWGEANASQKVKYAFCSHEDGIFKPFDLTTGKQVVHLDKISEIYDG